MGITRQNSRGYKSIVVSDRRLAIVAYAKEVIVFQLENSTK